MSMSLLLLSAAPALAAPYEYLPPIFPDEIAAADPVVGAQIRVARADAGDSGLLGALYLTDADAVVEAYAGLARVTVQHWFVNADPDLQGEAAYLLPLPQGALVDQVEVRCDDRRMSAGVEPRRPGDRLRDGKPLETFLLSEEGVLAWQFGSVCDGEIAVTVQYTAPLRYEGGTFSLALPPEPGAPAAVPWQDDGAPPRHEVTVYTDPGMPLASAVGAELVQACEGQRHQAHLSRDDGAGVWLSWSLEGAAATVYRPEPDELGYIALTLAPALLGHLTERRPRELLLVLDRSCSVSDPLADDLAQHTLLGAIAALGEADRFNVYALSAEVPPLFPEPQPATAASQAAALAWLTEAPQHAGKGGAPGLLSALESPQQDTDALRMLLLVTDGNFDDTGLRDAVRDAAGDPRLYAVGLGGYPNRALLGTLARSTRGTAIYPPPEAAPEVAARQAVALLQPPTLSDVEIDWGGLQVFHQLPLRLPDLHADQPLRIVARYDGTLDDSGGEILVRIQGQLGTLPAVLEIPVSLPVQQPHHEGLATLWAAEQIEALSDHAVVDAQPERVQRLMTELAVEHHLVTRYTQLSSPEWDTADIAYTVAEPVPVAIPAALAALDWKDAPPAPPAPPLPTTATPRAAAPDKAPTIYMSTVGMNIPTGDAADQIRRLVDARQGQIRHCYEQRLKLDSSIEGQLTVELEVAEGKVVDIRLAENSTGDADLGECALRRVASWEYPASVTGRMELPFNLSTRRR